MSNSKFYHFSAISGILSALLFIVSIVGLQFYLAQDLSNVGAFIDNMNSSHGMMLIYGWPGFIATVLIIPLVITIHLKNKSILRFSQSSLIITLIGLSFILVGYIMHLALTYFHAPLYASTGEAEIEVYDYIIQTTIGVQDMFWLSGDLLSFLGIALLVLCSVPDQYLPKWLIIAGVFAGICAAFGSFAFIPAFKHLGGLSFLFIGGFTLFAFWEIAVGIYFLRSK